MYYEKTKNILVTVGIVILLAVIVYVRSRISPLIGNYSVEKSEKKVEAKPTMDTKAQETKKQEKMKTTKPQETKKPKTKKSQGKTETSDCRQSPRQMSWIFLVLKH